MSFAISNPPGRIRGILLLTALLICPFALGQALADTPPSYAKDVRPFLAKYCSECHAGKEPESGLNLETYKGLMEGGDHACE